MNCVILAGGSGTRFWPLSRQKYPKQLLKIIGDTSMLQMTVDRLKKLKKVSGIYIITRKEIYKTIKNEIAGVPLENILVEPIGKNTAPAIGLVATHLALKDPQSIMGVFPADHLIVGHHKFEKAINTADHLARKGQNLVTIGIKPSYASTAYGYIQYDENSEEDHIDAYHVKTFAEKPHKKLAERFVESGDFLWNAGMFFWRTSTFLDAIEEKMPDLMDSLNDISQLLKKNIPIDEVWKSIKPESIDYGLLEKSDKIFVVKSDIKWNDIGSWKALYDVFTPNESGNVIRGKGYIMDGENNLIQSENKHTSILGVDNIVVINTPDATLVVSRDKVENIKKLVDYLIENGFQDII
jgi:mannose-1-phosphate guanylyltransferase